MAIADRKRRAWEERERLILDQADALLREHGYLGLNLDQLAQRIEYSKATIYNHFRTKEDLVLGVATMHLHTRRELFGRALTFPGRSRERMYVIGLADLALARLYPHWFPVMQLICTASLWEKAGEQTQARYLETSGACVEIMAEIIRQAREAGDLPADGAPPEQIIAGLMSMAKGAHLLAHSSSLIPSALRIRPQEVLGLNYHAYLDGVGWRPLGVDWEYEETRRRIVSTVLRPEFERIDG